MIGLKSILSSRKQKQAESLLGVASSEKPRCVHRFHVVNTSSRKLAIVLNDIHFPFHDTNVLAKILRVIEYLQPDHVILNGDIIDNYSLSSFLKDPARTTTLGEELKLCERFLTDIREMLPDCEISYTEGNHEDRLRRYLRSNAKALEHLDCLKFENLLGLDKLGVSYYGAEGFMLNPGFLVVHGGRVAKHAGMTAKDEFYHRLVDGISGHTHRFGRFNVTGHNGTNFWVENGCLCDLNPEYISGRPNWQHGFTLLEYDRNRVWDRMVRIEDGVVNIDGVVF